MLPQASILLDFLIFLLPGFVAAAIFYSLTSHPKPDSFERIILALIFTFIIQTIAQVVISVTEPAQQESHILPLLAIVAIAWGVIAAFCCNQDFPHRILRKIKITRENSFPSEWYSAFSQVKDCYIVLHLYDGRSIYGWPTEWPSKPAEGHFRLEDAEWIIENTNTKDTKTENTNTKDTKTVKSLLIPVTDVQIVEFVP